LSILWHTKGRKISSKRLHRLILVWYNEKEARGKKSNENENV
jgi:hypothetical protein